MTRIKYRKEKYHCRKIGYNMVWLVSDRLGR